MFSHITAADVQIATDLDEAIRNVFAAGDLVKVVRLIAEMGGARLDANASKAEVDAAIRAVARAIDTDDLRDRFFQAARQVGLIS